MITQDELKKKLHYNLNTGIFTWLVANHNRKIGDEAGTLYNGYIRICINYKRYPAHHLVWLYIYGVFPIKQLDHINHNPSDNRIENLREASQKTNSQNASKSKKNTSGFKGVSWDKEKNKWRARIRINNKNVHLGYFVCLLDAARVYDEKALDVGFHPNHLNF